MKEIWKFYIYNYEISNLGRLRNAKTHKILKANKIGRGYLGVCVSLGSRNNHKMIRIHRAVAESFIPNPNNLPQVNHKDGNKLNNCVDNLEWCNNQYNSQHAWDNGLNQLALGEQNHNSKLSKDDVDFIRANYKPYDKKYGTRALAKKYGVHHETIRQCLNEETWNKNGDMV